MAHWKLEKRTSETGIFMSEATLMLMCHIARKNLSSDVSVLNEVSAEICGKSDSSGGFERS
jgi:hypothetical protein